MATYLASGDAWAFDLTLEKPVGTPWSPPEAATASLRIVNIHRRPISSTITGLAITGASVAVVVPASETAKIRFFPPDEAERPIILEVQVDDDTFAQPETFYYHVRCIKGTI